MTLCYLQPAHQHHLNGPVQIGDSLEDKKNKKKTLITDINTQCERRKNKDRKSNLHEVVLLQPLHDDGQNNCIQKRQDHDLMTSQLTHQKYCIQPTHSWRCHCDSRNHHLCDAFYCCFLQPGWKRHKKENCEKSGFNVRKVRNNSKRKKQWSCTDRRVTQFVPVLISDCNSIQYFPDGKKTPQNILQKKKQRHLKTRHFKSN